MDLEFDDSEFMHPTRTKKQDRDEIRKDFINLVDCMLALQRNEPLNRFSIKCKDDVGSAPVIDWINKVLNLDVSELALHISSHWDWRLSSKVVVSETMVQEFWEACSVVSSRSLKRLTLRLQQRLDGNHKSVSFDTPNLVYFEYSDTIADQYPVVKFDSLVEASLDLRMTHEQIRKAKFSNDYFFKPDEETMVGNATDLVMGICNVKTLYLSDNTLEVLTFCCESMPTFDNLLQLTIKTDREVGWESLLVLLKNSPNLETLVFQGLLHREGKKCGSEECLCKPWEEEGIPTCLSSSPVKVLKILKFGDCEDEDMGKEMEQVQYFLQTMPNLEELIIHYETSADEDVDEVFSELEMVPRDGLTKCKIQVFPDSFNLSTS
ncbi:unnamed protein product [Microthlaspi erraticum]|uniref:FBD domain-containing protein n=1 Tax=Microthlaspi erraticum TaxID=1685480 RepID=A0A6D2HL60_9BRAS|nr:unnamed protein product [Microthlaspi erraticum]CAA7056496.1 unnamed protein product [Microthlaspi erraticum]